MKDRKYTIAEKSALSREIRQFREYYDFLKAAWNRQGCPDVFMYLGDRYTVQQLRAKYSELNNLIIRRGQMV